MENRPTSYFVLAQILITLAGFLFLASTVLWTQEKNFAFQGIEEIHQKVLAQERNESSIIVTWKYCLTTKSLEICSRENDYFEQSVIYNIWKIRALILGLNLTIYSFIFWFIGHKTG